MRALVTRGLLLPPLMCATLVCTPAGTAAALVDAGHEARGPHAAGAAEAPEPDVDALTAWLDALEAEFDALVAQKEAEADALAAQRESDADALVAQKEAETDALVAQKEAEADALVAQKEAEADALLARLDAASDVLVTRIGTLDRMDQRNVLAPLLRELTTLARLEGDRLEPAAAARHADAVKRAHATVQKRLRTLHATTPVTLHHAPAPATPHRTTPVTPHRAPAPVTPYRAAAAADPVADLLGTLQSAVDGLLKTLTSLDLGAVLGAVTGVLSPVLGVVTGLLQPVLGVVGGTPAALPALSAPDALQGAVPDAANTVPNAVPDVPALLPAS
ncbi:hypothetical protein ACFZCL_01455 [Streptomyces sp. NPDC008159]|uniref:hypothetical protein n=1 Tax=Streptomyces sp. NPDC008159 TaxID=3364817 RepID=UPI0036E10160